jgi:hypothetical protein
MIQFNRMKRLLQFVAVAVIVLLAAQPALAGMQCDMGTPSSGQCAPCCHKAMSHMGMGCPMQHQISVAGCGESCCKDALPRGVVLLAPGVKPKAGRAEFIAMAPRLVTDADAAFVGAPPGNAVTSAPARYILFQVFRI